MKNRRLFILLALCLPLLSGCGDGSSTSTSGYDPFMIGDNLEVISNVEAKLIANEAYNNLSNVTLLRRNTNNTEDDTNFYTNSFASYATNVSTTIYSEVAYYSNMIDELRNTTTTTYFGNDSTIEDKTKKTIYWYGIKPVKEGETPSPNYSLMTSTTENYNGISSTRYGVEKEDFSTTQNISPLWRRYLIESIVKNYLGTGIAYSADNTYVKDNQHIIGYSSYSEITTEPSKITPNKRENDYVVKTTYLSVVDFYNDELLGLGWTVKSVSTKVTMAYLTTIDGKGTENPLEVGKEETTTSLQYDTTHSSSESVPVYKIDNSRPFSIAKFNLINENKDIEFAEQITLENNDDYYSRVVDKFSGHAYYKEEILDVGYYSFFDGAPTDPKDYEKWGYQDIIANKCVNYILNPANVEDCHLDLTEHPKLFYVASKAKFSFRIVFDADMKVASEFTVAIIGR